MNRSLTLMPFQDTGSDWLAKAKRGMLVWDAGVGKTPTAVRACVKAKAKRVLVFCPPIAVSVWRDHFRDWSDFKNPLVMDATSAAKPFTFMQGEIAVRIVPYSRIRSAFGVMRAAANYPWDVVILDEAHYLKNSRALRTQGLYGVKLDLVGSPLKDAKHVWCLTGTPLLNHAAEFWTHLHALAPDTIIFPQLGKFPAPEEIFIDRFCIARNTPYGLRITGSKNTHELIERIKSFMDRKRLVDVIKDLPELRIVEYPLPADTYIARGLRQELADAMKALDLDPDALDDDALLSAIQAGGVAISTDRRLIGRAKAEGVVSMVNDLLEDDAEGKVILFAHHREVIRDLVDGLRHHNPLLIDGSVNPKMRETAIWTFQNKPAFRLIIISIEAAGESITLHAARNVVIAEPSPVPAKNQQAIARAHRKGQKHPVLAQFVLLPGTLDARLMSIIARKTRDIARIIDGASPAPVTVDFPDTPEYT